MGASASTLYNKLRALTGMNVSNFIRDQRMKAAMEIIQRSPDIRISDLAYKVGFKDP
jgi:AraC-like DNA-binding protein